MRTTNMLSVLLAVALLGCANQKEPAESGVAL